jgi:hypothetical protein
MMNHRASAAQDYSAPPSTVNNSGKMIFNSSSRDTHNRPMTANSIYSQETAMSGYPDDHGSSLESRSLGRDSALGPYMASTQGFGRYGVRDTPDYPNPFVQGSSVATEADNVVQMFLMNMNHAMAPGGRQHFDQRPPGKIENMTYPLGPTIPKIGDDQDSAAERSAVPRTVLSQVRKDFMSSWENEHQAKVAYQNVEAKCSIFNFNFYFSHLCTKLCTV